MIDLNPALLRTMPLPRAEDACDKDSRGRGVIVGSSIEVPGAVLLSGEAFLRAGAGKVQLAVPAPLAAFIGVAFPECGIIPLSAGGLLSEELGRAIAQSHCTLIGPGISDGDWVNSLLVELIGEARKCPFVVDAVSLKHLWVQRVKIASSGNSLVLTPHHGEMAGMLDISKEEVTDEAGPIAARVAQELGAVVVLKADTTYIAAPDGRCWRHLNGCVGLATSGSGDVLAGLLAGLIARGCEPAQAALWAVAAHAKAGDILTDSVGVVGFLARELVPNIPRALSKLSSSGMM
jgi:ADP-dependent NAD(P)H-hydrate dehydratase